MEQYKTEDLKGLFESWAREKLEKIEQLPPSGSYREYYRLKGASCTVIGVYNDDIKENIAFLGYTRHFFSRGLNVPEILAESKDKKFYIQQDLGDTALFSLILQNREADNSDKLIQICRDVLTELPKFQVLGHESLDYSVAYPRAEFDRQSMMWDLNYFKYYFLKLAKISFDEQQLEDDFCTLINFLLQAPRDYFLYRDFQSSNIMIYNNKPYFIDYQGGRMGALQYDPASFLFDAKADFSAKFRSEMLDFYVDQISTYYNINPESFKKYYYAFVLVRIMQAMGAFGFRGFYEKKPRFLMSIPYVLKTLKWLIANVSFEINIPALLKALEKISVSKSLHSIAQSQNK